MLEAHIDKSELDRLVKKLEQTPQVMKDAKRQALAAAAPRLKEAVQREIGGSGRVRSWQEGYVGSGGGYAAARPLAETFAESRGKHTSSGPHDKPHPTYAVGYMERVIILKNTDTGQALTLPVTPSSYPMAAGRAVERLDMAETGQIALPGLNTLFVGTLEFWLPAQSYPFLTAGAVADPSHYLGQLTEWSAAANVCRYIVTGTDINAPVLLGPLDYGESDGTNDVACKLPLYEYRYLDEAKAEKVTQNNGRPVDATSQPETAGSYTVVKGDSLWAICKKIYGDGSLAYKLATANNIKNPNLIYPGQVLTLPDKAVLAGYAATPAPSVAGTTTQTASNTGGSTKTAYEEAQQEKFAQKRAQRAQEQTAARAAARAALKLKLEED